MKKYNFYNTEYYICTIPMKNYRPPDNKYNILFF